MIDGPGRCAFLNAIQGSQNSQVRKPVRTENVPSPRDTPSLFGDCSRPRSAQSSQSDALSAKQAPTGSKTQSFNIQKYLCIVLELHDYVDNCVWSGSIDFPKGLVCGKLHLS